MFSCCRQCDQIGRNFCHLGYFLLNQFSPNQAVSTHSLLQEFEGIKSGLMWMFWVLRLNFGYFFITGRNFIELSCHPGCRKQNLDGSN
jgi:hypothetical protein